MVFVKDGQCTTCNSSCRAASMANCQLPPTALGIVLKWRESGKGVLVFSKCLSEVQIEGACADIRGMQSDHQAKKWSTFRLLGEVSAALPPSPAAPPAAGDSPRDCCCCCWECWWCWWWWDRRCWGVKEVALAAARAADAAGLMRPPPIPALSRGGEWM